MDECEKDSMLTDEENLEALEDLLEEEEISEEEDFVAEDDWETSVIMGKKKNESKYNIW